MSNSTYSRIDSLNEQIKTAKTKPALHGIIEYAQDIQRAALQMNDFELNREASDVIRLAEKKIASLIMVDFF
ncbi:hypothetical protein BCT47_21615 [Vibrio splendidus]|uniref:Uncharacterized protein n=1 Tax=Vibrio splendidus TaxID=29497 RepID=A0AB35N3H8_VIBSP|nr:hypothetical protein [Vibrio splendidus]MDP2502887.1 hypothetical protein [Vibrio splendidus]PMM74391.1 hypothetical protein BCT47_21615 [Vibrio splendidus]